MPSQMFRHPRGRALVREVVPARGNPVDVLGGAGADSGGVHRDIRRATQDDLATILTMTGRAFASPHPPHYVEQRRARFEPARHLLAHDAVDHSPVATAGSYSFELTMPAAGPVPTQGVTGVAVAATHRRQGLLRALMAEQLRGFVDEGLALCVLLASESGIYRRFGYGPVGNSREVRIDRRLARFREDVPDPGGVRFVDAGRARALAPDVHRRWAARTPGALSRSPAWWDELISDPEHRRGGATGLFHLVHPDGYAAYRVRPDHETAVVPDLFAATEQAHAALWRVLLGLDLITGVTTALCPLDDPLPLLLTDPRLVRTASLEDGLWARLLDVPAALAARRYRVELDLVLEVGDEFLGRGGRFRLRGGPDGACCERTGAAASVRLDVATLAMLLFGSHRASALARAGMLDGEPSILTRCDLAFGAEREVVHGTHF